MSAALSAPTRSRRDDREMSLGLPAKPPLLLHVFPSFAVGGAQVRLAAIANRFGDRWRHVVLPLDGRTDCMARIEAEVPFTAIAPPWEGRPGPVARLARIGALLRRLRPDLLVTSNWGSIEWAIANRLSARRPHLHTEDGFGPEESGGQFRRRVWARRLALRRSAVVLPSRTLLRMAKESWHLPEARLSLIPNGIDLDVFHPSTGRTGEGGPVIGTVAALRPEKNLGRLLRAAALLRREGAVFQLLVIGDGPEGGRLRALATELGIDDCTCFAGHVPDPAAAYRTMDVVCLSSDTEQMPFCVLEAMATGLPVAATDVGDIGVMLATENAPHLALRTDAGLANALRPLLREPALRARIGRANRAKAERDYDREVMFQAFATRMEGIMRA